MRIAWLVYGDLGQPTGGYVYDRIVVEGLRVLGDEIAVIDPRSAPALLDPVDVVVGDALCAPELGPLFETVAARAARVLLVHHFASWEVDCGDRDAMRIAEARAVDASDVLVATGDVTRETLGACYPGRSAVTVVPGADRLRPQSAASKPRDGASRIDLLFVGSLVVRKRLSLLLDAIEDVADPNLALTLAGDPSREPEHAAWIAARIEASPVLRRQVTRAGVVSDEALARRMAEADALVLPSGLEGYGMVLTEALAAGLPVLAARPAAAAAGLARHAAVLAFDDRVGLAATLRRFLHDATLRAAMRRAAAASVLPRWVDAVAAFRGVLVTARRGP